jgi:hypothetical protein
MCVVSYFYTFFVHFFFKKYTIEFVKLTCRSYRFNGGFAHFLYENVQEMGKKWKSNIYLNSMIIDNGCFSCNDMYKV